jgi:hypothetical protein
LVALACDPKGPSATPPEPEEPSTGRDEASSDDLAPIVTHFDDAEPGAIAERGSTLAWMEHTLTVGLERGLPRVGRSTAAAAMPIASVDPGLHSGQVTIYRWMEDDLDREGNVRPELADRWLIIPMLLRPDRVLELEQMTKEVDMNSPEFHTIAAVDLAQRTLRQREPAGQWNAHPFREQALLGHVNRGVTRVYMLGRDAADYEVVVRDALGRKKEPKVLAVRKHHDPAAMRERPPRIELPRPSPLTVARVLPHVPVGGRVTIAASDGSRWTIDERGVPEPAGADPASDD